MIENTMMFTRSWKRDEWIGEIFSIFFSFSRKIFEKDKKNKRKKELFINFINNK